MTEREQTAFELLAHVVIKCGWGWLYAVNSLEKQYQRGGSKLYAEAAHRIRALQLLPPDERDFHVRELLMGLAAGVVPR